MIQSGEVTVESNDAIEAAEAAFAALSADVQALVGNYGYIVCTYSSNGVTLWIPYELKNGDISLDLGAVFSIS